MKRVLFACIIGMVAMLAFSSCSKDDDLPDPLDGVSHIVQDLQPEEWERQGNRYTFVLDLPELDELYFQDGHVSVAISLDNESDYYYNIPAQVGRHDYSAKYGVGTIVVDADYIGGGTPVAPRSMYMKIVLTDAEVGSTL
ncbi:MAG: hypothetical protein ACTHZ1_06055 [Sphingobacterium sp.]